MNPLVKVVEPPKVELPKVVAESPRDPIAKASPTEIEQAAVFLRKHARAELATADEYEGTDAEAFHRVRAQAMKDAASWVENRMWILEEKAMTRAELIALYDKRQARAARTGT